uniref:Single domain-containing protein n=1 Tax=Stomoxys calcitrans TaxID=35570 RepID=A0A1I8Q0Y5_STOCA
MVEGHICKTFGPVRRSVEALDDHCYFKDHNLTIKVNETIFPTNIEDYCYKMFCRRFEDDYVIDVSFCPGATLVCGKRDYSKPFPECCGICE